MQITLNAANAQKNEPSLFFRITRKVSHTETTKRTKKKTGKAHWQPHRLAKTEKKTHVCQLLTAHPAQYRDAFGSHTF